MKALDNRSAETIITNLRALGVRQSIIDQYRGDVVMLRKIEDHEDNHALVRLLMRDAPKEQRPDAR